MIQANSGIFFIRSDHVEVVGRTKSEERLLQISLHLLPDALLYVIGAVALIPVKH